MIEKGNYRHFMLKEIYEQPTVVAQTLRAYIRAVRRRTWRCRQMDFDLAAVKRVTIVACGTSFYAGHGRQILVRAVRARAGRHRCRQRVPLSRAGAGGGRAGAVHLAIGRDRRHAGGAAPLQGARGRRSRVVVNVPTITMAREADLLLPTHAGPEIGVASTKAFTCQLAVLAALAAQSRARQGPDEPRGGEARSSRHLLRGARRAQRRARP